LNNRQFIFCLATALTLVVIGSISSAQNPQHWTLYAVAGLLVILSLSSRKDVKLWRANSASVRQA